MSRSTLLSGWFKQFNTPTRLIPLAHVRPTLVRPRQVTRVSLQQQRFVQSAPKEYNSIESAAHHFKQQRHMPYFMEYLMWVVFGSEALHLIWLKIDYKEYKEKMRYKTKLLEEIIERVENGERIDDSSKEEIKMILMNNKHEGDYHDDIDDDYLNSLISSSEQSTTKDPVEKEKKPVVESKWVEIKESDENASQKKKEPFFL